MQGICQQLSYTLPSFTGQCTTTPATALRARADWSMPRRTNTTASARPDPGGPACCADTCTPMSCNVQMAASACCRARRCGNATHHQDDLKLAASTQRLALGCDTRRSYTTLFYKPSGAATSAGHACPAGCIEYSYDTVLAQCGWRAPAPLPPGHTTGRQQSPSPAYTSMV